MNRLHARSELEGEAGSRPPLCVTASVEAIELHSSRLDLHQDMQVGWAMVVGGYKEGRRQGGSVPRLDAAGWQGALERRPRLEMHAAAVRPCVAPTRTGSRAAPTLLPCPTLAR